MIFGGKKWYFPSWSFLSERVSFCMCKMLDIGTFLSEASKLIYTGVKISLSNAVGGICCFVAVIYCQELHRRIPDHLYRYVDDELFERRLKAYNYCVQQHGGQFNDSDLRTEAIRLSFSDLTGYVPRTAF